MSKSNSKSKTNLKKIKIYAYNNKDSPLISKKKEILINF